MRTAPLLFLVLWLFGAAHADLSLPPFASFDADDSGRIEAPEMGAGLVQLLGNATVAVIERVLGPQRPGDGEIDRQEYEEFTRGMRLTYTGHTGRQLLHVGSGPNSVWIYQSC